MRVTGVDRAEAFLRAADRPAGATYVRGDARALPLADGCAAAVVCLCQGGFGLLGGGDDEQAALASLARLLAPGARLAVTAFSSYFAVRHLEEGEEFEALPGLFWERSTVRSAGGDVDRTFTLATTCFTPRELRLMAAGAGLRVEGIWSVAPGRYRTERASIEDPEWLMIAGRPGDGDQGR